MKNLAYIMLLLTAAACHRGSQDDALRCERMNELSYHYRYINIDSALFYTAEVEKLARPQSDEWTEAQINRAFVAYQQMNFDEALRLLATVLRQSKNQFYHLSVHILSMKIAQRVGDGESFFTHRNHAMRILNRVQEGYESVSPHYQKIINYANSELHIVASTYYYYLGLDSSARSEISQVLPYVKDALDTAQWLNYNYMLGSGGLIVDSPENVTLREFEHLFLTYTMSTAKHYTYFEANALQSLASMLSDTLQANLIRQHQPASYSFIEARFPCENPSEGLGFALARRAVELFEEYDDPYQTACAYRTMGELYLRDGKYDEALPAFLHALSIVEEQTSRSHYTVNPWIASIREKLSMTYSALGDKHLSDVNRNIYLDLLDQYRQNYESETRLSELKSQVASVRVRTFILCLLILFTSILSYIFVRRTKSRSQEQVSRLRSYADTDEFHALSDDAAKVVEHISDDTEIITDKLGVSRLHIENYKAENVERRAKVALVYSIIPYLDRMMAEVRKMRASANPDPERLQYVGELASEIMRINETLTDWIKMSQGSLNLHVTTFPLQDIIDVIALSRHTFEQKGITLNLPETKLQVKADKALTLFMINTLADNARKYTPNGGEVSIRVSGTEDYVEVSVADTGVGLSEDDCRILNDNKVYDASAIGSPGQQKGFGFGIMNCKGIINKYRKSSALFRSCEFGVESKLGQGSRFWFRLPQVLTFILLLMSLRIQAAPTDYEALYHQFYNANVEGRHEDVLREGRNFMSRLDAPFDTASVVLVYNEIAVAALATHSWDIYRQSNGECVRLHKLFTQDDTIEAYCAQMQQLHTRSVVIYLMLILFALAALILFYLLYLRKGLRSRRFHNELADIISSFNHKTRQSILSYESSSIPVLQQAADADTYPADLTLYRQLADECTSDNPTLAQLAHDAIERMAQCHAGVLQKLSQLFKAEADLRKSTFEEDRLYVMNQILDNALSTIKHETMYYPARARQMVDFMQQNPEDASSLNELHDLLQYYHDVYLILYNQADRQLEQNNFRREALPVAEIVNSFCEQAGKEIRRSHLEVECQAGSAPDAYVWADRLLLADLMQCLLADYLSHATFLRVSAAETAGTVGFSILFGGLNYSEAEADALFSPASRSFRSLTARQIIKEHDAHCGMPGLRLYAQPVAGGLEIIFTLKQKT